MEFLSLVSHPDNIVIEALECPRQLSIQEEGHSLLQPLAILGKITHCSVPLIKTSANRARLEIIESLHGNFSLKDHVLYESCPSLERMRDFTVDDSAKRLGHNFAVVLAQSVDVGPREKCGREGSVQHVYGSLPELVFLLSRVDD